MPRRDLYKVLGVSAQAAPGEIKQAYRRIVFAVHPDVGEHPDPQRFREVHEAYEVLSHPDRRHSYDIGVAGERPLPAARRSVSEPLRIFDDFLTVHPPLEEVFDHIRQNFFGHRPKSGGAYRRLGLEAILEREEARFGCTVPLYLPGYVRCGTCGGIGYWWGFCPECHGRGIVQNTRELLLTIPPGTRDGQHYHVELDGIGIGNLALDVRVVVK